MKTKQADSESADKLSNALDTANQNYKDLMESKEKISADFEDYKQRSESTIETMQTSMNDKDNQLDETKAKLEKLQSELTEAHQKIQYHERNDQERFCFDALKTASDWSEMFYDKHQIEIDAKINHEAVQDDQLVDSLKKSINKADDDNAFNAENGEKLNGTGTDSTQLNRTKRVPKPRKQSETGSTEVNKVKRAITGNSSTTSSRMGRRARLTSQGWFSHRMLYESYYLSHTMIHSLTTHYDKNT